MFDQKLASMQFYRTAFLLFIVSGMLEIKAQAKTEGVVNVRLISINLDTMLMWNSPLSMVGEFQNHTDVNMQFSVFYLTYNETSYKWSWEPIPTCINIEQHYCWVSAVPVLPFEFNGYAVNFKIGENNVSNPVTIDDFVPSVDGYLQAPNFTVETDGKMAKLSIPDPPRVRWSGQLLSEVLETDNPMYTIQYWLKNETAANSRIFTIRADVLSFHIPLSKASPHCFRMSLSGFQFLSVGWTDPVCMEDKSSHAIPQGTAVLMQIILGCLGGAAFVALCVILVSLTIRLNNYIRAKSVLDLPPSLASVMNRSESRFRFEKNDDMDVECANVIDTPHRSFTNFSAPRFDNQSLGDKGNRSHVANESMQPSLYIKRQVEGPPVYENTRFPEQSGLVKQPLTVLTLPCVEDEDPFPEYVSAPLSPDSGLEDCETGMAFEDGVARYV